MIDTAVNPIRIDKTTFAGQRKYINVLVGWPVKNHPAVMRLPPFKICGTTGQESMVREYLAYVKVLTAFIMLFPVKIKRHRERMHSQLKSFIPTNGRSRRSVRTAGMRMSDLS